MKKILLAVILMPWIVHAENVDGYDTYYNSRFGFKVSYPGGGLTGELNPSTFIPTGEPANGDGQYFVQSTGDAVILASGSYNYVADASEGEVANANGMLDYCHLKTMLKNHELDKVTYQRQIGNTAIYSGFHGKDIVYVKGISANSPNQDMGSRCITLRIKYPADQKEAYDEIVKNVANSFEPIE